MANQYCNKVVINGEVELDLTADTVTAATLLSGKTAHDKSGAKITGTMPSLASATADATASADEILYGNTAYVNGSKITGTMPNKGGVTGTISTKAGSYVIPAGYHDGSGKVTISSTEQAKIIAGNIKSGVQILGVTGTYAGEIVAGQTKTVTPTFSVQSITPDSNYDHLTEVTVNAISVTRTDNTQGGYTLTI